MAPYFDEEKLKKDWGFLSPFSEQVPGYQSRITPSVGGSVPAPKSRPGSILSDVNTSVPPEDAARRLELRRILMPQASSAPMSSPDGLLDENEFLSQMTGETVETPERSVALSPPNNKAVVSNYLKTKAQQDPNWLRDEERIARAEEFASGQKLRAGLGSAVQQMIGAISRTEPNTKYQDAQYVSADKGPQQVREYLLNKAKNEKELAALTSDQAYKKRTIELQEAELGQKGAKISADLAIARGQRETPFGVAKTDDDAKKAKDFAEAYKNYTWMLDQLTGLREKWGGEAYGPIRGKMQNLSTNALLEFKKMAQLGNLSAADIALVEDALGEVTSHTTSTESVLARLNQERANADSKLESFANVRGLDPSMVKTAKQPLQEDVEEKKIDDSIKALQEEIQRMKGGKR